MQLRPGHDGSDEDAPSHRLPWYGCACCPPNLSRLLASLNGYAATTDASGVQVHLYSPATIRAGSVVLRVGTSYPWDGRIEVAVESADSDEPWTLALRIPGWCAGVRASIDGSPIDVDVDDGYLRVHRSWPSGTSLVLELDMPARLIAAHPRVDAVRGCVAFARGPLVYCVEQTDLEADVALDDVRVDGAAPPVAVARDDVLDVPVVIRARAVVASAPPALYPDWAGPGDASAPFELTAIPYYRWANREPGPMRVWVPIAT